MKKSTPVICLAAWCVMSLTTSAQEPLPLADAPKKLAFYKRALVTSISAGPSMAMVSTFRDDGKHINSECSRSYIDPLIMEFGLSNKLGVGFSKGGENYDVNANEFYQAALPSGCEWMTARTRYYTADISYHTFVTERLDISVFGSAGYYNVNGSCYEQMSTYNDQGQLITYGNRKELFNYNGNGAVVRGGVRSRWYFSKRFGLFAMLYGFNGLVKNKPTAPAISDAPKPKSYYTSMKGVGLEFGLCCRIFKQLGLPKVPREEGEDRLITFVAD